MSEPLTDINLTTCGKEPIHIPGAVQSHGILLVLGEESLRIIQMSANAPAELKLNADVLLGSTLPTLFEGDDVESLMGKLLTNRTQGQHRYLSNVRLSNLPGVSWTAACHRWQNLLFIELERELFAREVSKTTVQAALRTTVNDLDTCETLESFCQSAAEHFRHFTEFDRVMIYRFLEDGSGVVIAEDRPSDMDPYLDLRYPASDIPVQARQLYISNPYRLTADVNSFPIPLVPKLNPRTNAPLDMSFCSLRATSPIHLEYLRSMGVTASLSFSIVNEGRLWGLVACHHRKPRILPQEIRIAGELLGRLVGLQVGIKEELEHRQYVADLHRIRGLLSSQVGRSGDFGVALTGDEPNLLSGILGSGAALFTGSRVYTVGKTPEPRQIEQLCEWSQSQAWTPVWSSHKLAVDYPAGEEFSPIASGVLMVRIASGSPESVLWFRPEVIQTVNWAGNPGKSVETSADGSATLHPRRSFALWREQVRGEAVPWQAAELEHAAALQESLAQALLQHRAMEISRLNTELLRSNRELDQFASIASHDLREPLRTVTTYTQLLLRHAGNTSDFDREQAGKFIVDATRRMGMLVDSLLEFARLGQSGSQAVGIASELALQDALNNLQSRIREHSVKIEFGELPNVVASVDQLARVFQNLIANAIKYRREDTVPHIQIRAKREGRHWVFYIQDNGTGFDSSYAQLVFQSFQRLHGREYEGSGLGLAICRKIIESFGGKIWAESEPGVGSTFLFSLQAA